MQSLQSLFGLGDNSFPWLQGESLATIEPRHFVALGVLYHYGKKKRTLACVIISHLAFNVYHSLSGRDVEVGGIDICARGAEVGIERQCLVELVGDVQIDVLRYASIVGVEVAVVPLVAAVQRAVAVCP